MNPPRPMVDPRTPKPGDHSTTGEIDGAVRTMLNENESASDPSEARCIDDLPPILRVSEAAAYLRCDPATVYALIRRGELAVVRLGRAFRITRDALARFVASG
jgi:excisionase family DNA binding protein